MASSIMVLGSIIAVTTPSGADASAAEALIRQGLALRREHRDAEALEVFRAACALEPSARAGAQVALALQALGRWVEAESTLESVLRQPDAWVTANRETLQSALGVIQTHLGWIHVSSTAHGAEVRLDGERVGTVPLAPLRVHAGPHVCELRLRDGVAVTRTVSLRAGEHWVMELDPQHLPAAEPPSTNDAKQPSNASRGTPASATTAEGRLDVRRTYAWGTAAVAGVAALNGGVALVIRELSVAKYNGDSCSPTPSVKCGNHADTARAMAITAGITFGVAGAFAVASAILFAGRSSPRPSVVVAASPDSIGLGWHGTF